MPDFRPPMLNSQKGQKAAPLPPKGALTFLIKAGMRTALWSSSAMKEAARSERPGATALG